MTDAALHYNVSDGGAVAHFVLVAYSIHGTLARTRLHAENAMDTLHGRAYRPDIGKIALHQLGTGVTKGGRSR